ncbi:MAG TPA: hypothetical protein VKA21_15150 [Candidatus Binatia bacterium]|nr:hypothetical protein [Candidatus Binatia bacterium]
MGVCRACGVTFAAGDDQRAQAAKVLGVHQAICPGGRREGEVVRPYR